jgi:hypothetical protein
MKLPFVTRSHHEEVVAMKDRQITGLARTLYGGDVPEEMQLILGISIPATGKQAEPAEEEKPLSDEDKLVRETKSKENEFKRRLEIARRVRPSQVGPMLAAEKVRRIKESANLANPAKAVFAQAREKAINQ